MRFQRLCEVPARLELNRQFAYHLHSKLLCKEPVLCVISTWKLVDGLAAVLSEFLFWIEL